MPYSTAATGSATSPVVTSSGTKPQPLSGAAMKTKVFLLAGPLLVATGDLLFIAPKVQNFGGQFFKILSIVVAGVGLVITAVATSTIGTKKFEAPSTTHQAPKARLQRLELPV